MEKQSHRPPGRLRKPQKPTKISSQYSPMKSESKRILLTIQRKAINPITDKPMFRTSDEVLEEALEVFYQHHKGKKVLR